MQMPCIHLDAEGLETTISTNDIYIVFINGNMYMAIIHESIQLLRQTAPWGQ